MKCSLLTPSLFVLFALFTAASAGAAADLKLLAPSSFRTAIGPLAVQYEKVSGDHVRVEYEFTGAILSRVNAGEQVDVLIASDFHINALTKEGSLEQATPLASLRIGALIAEGAKKPKIDTVERFKEAVLSAGSLVYTNPAAGSPVGSYMSTLFASLGIAEQCGSKTLHVPPGGYVLKAVARHLADLGFDSIPIIAAGQGIDLVGPLPTEIQNISTFSLAVMKTSDQLDASKRLVAFLTSVPAQTAMISMGFETPSKLTSK